MNKKDENFDKALDEAFDAIVKGRIEDATEAVTKLTERIEQEVNTNRSAPDSVESVILDERDSLMLAEMLINPPAPNAKLVEAAKKYNDLDWDDFYPPIG